jgi:hypothetical protein
MTTSFPDCGAIQHLILLKMQHVSEYRIEPFRITVDYISAMFVNRQIVHCNSKQLNES